MRKVITEIPAQKDRRWKAWAKVVEKVDTTKTNGWAYEGEFVPVGRKAELEAGSIVIYYQEIGSRANREPVVTVYRVTDNGTLEELLRTEGLDWALNIRDQVAELVNKSKADELEALRAEAEALRTRLAEVEAKIAALEETR